MKHDLRRQMLDQRLQIDTHDAEVASSRIMQTLLELDCIKKANCVMAYYSHKNEPNLLALMHALIDMGKEVALPYVADKDNLIAVEYTYDSIMRSNVYGIPEPIISNESEQAEPDVVLVPGVVFDTSLSRIGFGVGYYDRFLKETDALKIGICFDMQVVAHIDAQPYDVSMDMIVTESRVLGQI